MRTERMAVVLGVVLGAVVVLTTRQGAYCQDGPPPEAMMGIQVPELGGSADTLASPDRPGSARVEQTRERIERLRAKAEAVEQEARRLRTEAAELERRLGPRPGPVSRVDRMPMQRGQIRELEREMERAEREGLPEAARMLRERLQMARRQTVRPEAASGGQVVRLREIAREAKDREDMEEVRRLKAKAKELEDRRARSAPEEPAMPERLKRMRQELADIRQAAARAEKEGRKEEAARMRAEVRDLAVEIDKASGKAERRDIEQRIRQLRWMAAQAKDAGDNDGAQKMRQEAETLERRISDAPGSTRSLEEMRGLIAELRTEIGRLRGQVEELKLRVRGR
jgi:chromosome segregation ATPase